MKKMIFFSLMILSLHSFASGDHHEEHGEHDEHKSEQKDEHADEHADHKEEDGFKLNDKSIKNFGLKTLPYKGGELSIPTQAVFKGLNEVNIYRLREGLYKRIDFTTSKSSKETLSIKSKDLKPNDHVVISGIGFLRIAEIAASGGISDSHSH